MEDIFIKDVVVEIWNKVFIFIIIIGYFGYE